MHELDADDVSSMAPLPYLRSRRFNFLLRFEVRLERTGVLLSVKTVCDGRQRECIVVCDGRQSRVDASREKRRVRY